MCQPKFLPETPAPSECRPESKKRKAPSASTNRTRILSLEELQDNFHLPINEVATKLGVCVTVLKQQCRELGIVRWPYRKVRKLDNMLTALETAGPTKARPFALTNIEEERQRKICTVKKTLKELVADPNSCAHLKLGKIKNASLRADLGQPESAKGILERLEMESHTPTDGDLSVLAGGQGSSESESGDSAVLQNTCGLLWGSSLMHLSESSGSKGQGSLPGLNPLRTVDGISFRGEIDNASSPGTEGLGNARLALDLGQLHRTPPPETRPLRDLQACWWKAFSGSMSRSTSALEQGPSSPAIDEPTKMQHPALENCSAGRDASSTRWSPPSMSDAEESAHGDCGSAPVVELDLISRLGSPKAKGRGEADPHDDKWKEELVPGTGPATSGRALNFEQTAAILSPQEAAVVGELSAQFPAVGIPVPVGYLPTLDSVAAMDAFQLRCQQTALHQHHYQQQLLAFLGCQPQEQITPAMVQRSVDVLNAQRQAYLAGAFGPMFNVCGMGGASSQLLPPSMMPAFVHPENPS